MTMVSSTAIGLFLFFLGYLSSFAHLIGETHLVVNVTIFEDVDYPILATNCDFYPNMGVNCSLRTAWNLCMSTFTSSNASAHDCLISLPSGETLYQNISNGPLRVATNTAFNITVEGNNAIIRGVGERDWISIPPSFPHHFVDNSSAYQYRKTTSPSFFGCSGAEFHFFTCNSNGWYDLSVEEVSTNQMIQWSYDCAFDFTVPFLSNGDVQCQEYYIAVEYWWQTDLWIESFFIDQIHSLTDARWILIGDSNDTKAANHDVKDLIDERHIYVGALEDTSSATKSFSTFTFTACPRLEYELSFCNETGLTSGDTYMRLFNDDGEQVKVNDDYCGYASYMLFALPTYYDTCRNYSLNMGCYDSTLCTIQLDFRVWRYASTINSTMLSSSKLSIHNLVIDNFGSSHTKGGAIFINRTMDFTMKSVTFVNNIALQGGAVAITADSVSMTNVTFFNNSAIRSGGSAYFNQIPLTPSGGGIHMHHMQFVDTTSLRGAGGAVAVESCSFGYFEDIVTTSCQSLGNGGCLDITDSTEWEIHDINVSHARSFLGNGGGVNFLRSFYITVSNFYAFETIASHYDDGGALYAYYSHDITWSHIYTHNCIAGSYGGSVALYDVQNAILFDIFMYNSSSSWGGGGMDILFSYDISISHIQGYRNHARYSEGGAIGIYYVGGLQLSHCWLEHNTAGYYGGALYLGTVGNVTMSDIVVINNKAQYGHGGGAAFYGLTNGKISNLTVTGNSANGFGGGASFEEITNCEINGLIMTNNTARSDGGSLYLNILNNVDVIHMKILNSTTVHGKGGGLCLDSNSNLVSFADFHVENNRAQLSGGGIYIGSSNQFVSMLGERSKLRSRYFDSQKESQHEYVFPNASSLLIYFDGQTSLSSPQAQVSFTFVLFPEPGDESSNLYGSHNDDDIGQYYSYAKERRWSKSYYSSSDLPGINSAPFVIRNCSKVTIYFTDSSSTINNGPSTSRVSIHVVPIYYDHNLSLDGISNRNVIHDNHANVDGGGLVLAVVNPVFLIMDTDITNNEAIRGSGGGLALTAANAKSAIINCKVRFNRAQSDGGGVYMGYTHYAVLFQRCEFMGNAASGNGGALFIAANNGMKVIKEGNEIFLKETVIVGNNAASGGAGYCLDRNIIRLKHTTVSENIATDKDGGGFAFGNMNQLSFDGTTFRDNRAQRGLGGGLLVQGNDSTIVLKDTVVVGNVASTGAGVALIGRIQLTMMGNVSFLQNQATIDGGALLLAWSKMFTGKSEVFVQFSHNSAKTGSALLFYGLDEAIEESIEYGYSYSNWYNGHIEFHNNHASSGSTVYWIYDKNVMSQPPAFISEEYSSWNIRWDQNTDAIGQRISTQPVSLLTNDNYMVSNYQGPLHPTINVTIIDFYGNIVNASKEMSIRPSILRSASQCSKLEPFLAGQQEFLFSKGIANFNEFRANCHPLGHVLLQLTVPLEPLKEVLATRLIRSLSSYSLLKNLTILFRQCTQGEQIIDGNCVTCPAGSYNLERDGSGICVPCSGEVGIRFCEANQLHLQPGYWRRHEDSHKVMECLLGVNSCPGGINTGDAACADGYGGPLCASCVEGYYKSQGHCLPCDNAGFSVMRILALIAMICLFGVVVFVWSQYKIILSWIPDRIINLIHWIQIIFNEVVDKVKIIVATFQVVISTADVFDVNLPLSYTSFARLFNFTNPSSVTMLPIACWMRFNFIHKLLWATLTPFGVLFLLIVAASVEYGLEKRKHEDPVKSKEVFNSIKSRYMNYIFYLTYLVLPSVTTTIFQLFVCRNVDPQHEDSNDYDSYLVADVKISCNSSYYKSWLVYGYLMILVYPVGISAFYLFCLYRVKDEIVHRDDCKIDDKEHPPTNITATTTMPHESLHPESRPLDNNKPLKELQRGTSYKALQNDLSKSAMRLAFLWKAYKPEFWYWEIVENSRRIFLTAVLSVCATGSTKQYVLGILVAFFFMKLYAYFQPYIEYQDYRLAEIGQTQIFITYFAALIVSDELLYSNHSSSSHNRRSTQRWSEGIGALMVIVNLPVLLVAIYHQWQNYLTENKEVSSKIQELTTTTRKSIVHLISRSNSYLSTSLSISERKKLSNVNTKDSEGPTIYPSLEKNLSHSSLEVKETLSPAAEIDIEASLDDSECDELHQNEFLHKIKPTVVASNGSLAVVVPVDQSDNEGCEY